MKTTRNTNILLEFSNQIHAFKLLTSKWYYTSENEIMH